MVWCCTSYADSWSSLYGLWNLDGERVMRYVAVCVMWASVAAIGIFGGPMGPFAAIIIAIFALFGMMLID